MQHRPYLRAGTAPQPPPRGGSGAEAARSPPGPTPAPHRSGNCRRPGRRNRPRSSPWRTGRHRHPAPPLRHHFATAPPVGPCLCASSREKWPVRGGAGAWWGRGLGEAPPTAPAAPPTCSGAAPGGPKPSGLLNETSKDEGCGPTGVQIHRNGVLYGMEPVGVHIHRDVAPLGLGLCGVKTHGWSSMGMRTQGCIPMGI